MALQRCLAEKQGKGSQRAAAKLGGGSREPLVPVDKAAHRPLRAVDPQTLLPPPKVMGSSAQVQQGCRTPLPSCFSTPQRESLRLVQSPVVLPRVTWLGAGWVPAGSPNAEPPLPLALPGRPRAQEPRALWVWRALCWTFSCDAETASGTGY